MTEVADYQGASGSIRGADHVGVTFALMMSLPPTRGPQIAARAADLGYGSFWTAETTGPEAFSLLAAAGAAAPTLGLGTGVLALQVRTPMLAAMAAATLQALHPDVDIYLGIGISSPVVTKQWHSVEYRGEPLAQVREYVTLVKECLSGEPVTFQGDFYDVRRFRLGIPVPERRRPKLVVGALNPHMLRLAGEIADGVLLNYLPASHVPWSVAQVRAGGQATIYANVHVVVADRDDCIDSARRDLFSYAVVDAYAHNFRRAGFGDEVDNIRERHAANDRRGALAAVSDRFVDSINVIGDEETVHTAVQSYVDAGIQVPLVTPLPWGPDPSAAIEATLHAAIRSCR
jgi:probable F420-dependent oxidoreductase